MTRYQRAALIVGGLLMAAVGGVRGIYRGVRRVAGLR